MNAPIDFAAILAALPKEAAGVVRFVSDTIAAGVPVSVELAGLTFAAGGFEVSVGKLSVRGTRTAGPAPAEPPQRDDAAARNRRAALFALADGAMSFDALRVRVGCRGRSLELAIDHDWFERGELDGQPVVQLTMAGLEAVSKTPRPVA